MCLCGTAASASLLPGLAPGSVRATVDPAAPPWVVVARINVPGVSRCTAVLVAPSVAVTAAHCVVSLRLGHEAPPSAIHVLTFYPGGAARHAVAASVRVAPGYDVHRVDETRGADVALVTLPTKLIDEASVLKLEDAGRGEPVMLGGYSQDRAERITADTQCRTTGYAADGEGRPLLVHDCAGTRGTSGGAVLRPSRDGWTVAGMEVAAFDGRAGGVAIPASTIRRLLQP